MERPCVKFGSGCSVRSAYLLLEKPGVIDSGLLMKSHPLKSHCLFPVTHIPYREKFLKVQFGAPCTRLP